jgi:hypothetical protein
MAGELHLNCVEAEFLATTSNHRPAIICRFRRFQSLFERLHSQLRSDLPAYAAPEHNVLERFKFGIS